MDKTISTHDKKNQLLNFMKGCACMGVVFMHVHFPGKTGYIVHKISDFAVPLFFMISGYYAYCAEWNASEKIIRRIRKICRITFYTLLFYLIFTICKCICNHSLGEWFRQLFSLRKWIGIIFLSDLEFLSGGVLWFLPSQIISYLILLLVDKKQWYDKAYKCIPLLFIIRIAVITIVTNKALSWHYSCNFLIGALPWMILGNYLAYKETELLKLKNSLLAGTAIAGIGFALLFVVKRFPVDLAEFGVVVYAVALFMLALKNPSCSVFHPIKIIGAKYSFYVYIMHTPIYDTLGALERRYGLGNFAGYAWVKPFAVLGITIVVSILIERVKREFPFFSVAK